MQNTCACIYKNVNCCKSSHFVIFQPAEICGKIYVGDAFIPISLLLTAFCCKESILMIPEKIQNSAWCKICTVKLTWTPADKYFQYSIWIENLAPFRDDPLYSPWIKMMYSILRATYVPFTRFCHISWGIWGIIVKLTLSLFLLGNGLHLPDI